MGVYSTLLFHELHNLPYPDWQTYELNPMEGLPIFDVDAHGLIRDEDGNLIDFDGYLEMIGGFPECVKYKAGFRQGKLVSLEKIDDQRR